MDKHLIIRTDASTGIGTGHFMRCLALGQAWQEDGGTVSFISSCQNVDLVQQLHDEKFEVFEVPHPYPHDSDWEYTRAILNRFPDTWVALDGYHFDEAYQQRIKQSGHRLLVIDDTAHLNNYFADILLNQNLDAPNLRYPTEFPTHLLLGPRYALLRKEFLLWTNWKRVIPKLAQRVLITLGGSDPNNHTLQVIQAMNGVAIPGLEAVVVVGASNPNIDLLRSTVEQSCVPTRLVTNAKNMSELMMWADVAICAAGSTVWELLFLRTPVLALILARNQEGNAAYIDKHQLGITLGWARDVKTDVLTRAISSLLVNYDARMNMSNKADKIVDGKGAQRVVRTISELSTYGLSLRPVLPGDSRLLWRWANDPSVRAMSFSTDSIDWDDHKKWFESKLVDLDCHFYIVLKEDCTPIGQVRCEVTDNDAVINVSIAQEFRGCGYGSKSIRMASERVLLETSVSQIFAYVKPDNKASLLAFEEAGYEMTGPHEVKGHSALRFILSKDKGSVGNTIHSNR